MENRMYALEGSDPKFIATETIYNRILTIYNNMSIPHIFRNYKLHKVATLLVETDFKLDQIAYIAGFENEHVLAKHFLDKYGITPSQYRANKSEKK